MAQPVNIISTHNQVGIREDLSDTIYNIKPHVTPFLTKCAKTKATNVFHEWQTDTLRASAVNAHIDGADTSADARVATVRLGNYTQILKNAVTVSGSDAGLDKAGRDKTMAYQIVKVLKEHKLDIEKALFASQARVAGGNSSERYLAGLPAWLYTNTFIGSGGSDATGDGTNTRTDGTQTAFTQANFNTVMQSAWENGGEPTTVYLSAFQMDVAQGFTGNNSQRSMIQASENTVSDYMSVYQTPWGRVKFIPSRENRGRDVFIIQDDMWKVATKRPTKQEPLAKTGDSDRTQVVTELTLVSCNEAASGGVFDATT